ncbi:MAG TPA: DUF4331 domain-containing protein [Chloroflexia bacterium]|nr:DUF4331 domain-containing protein [Chloroflexia bacterium]
MKLSRKINTILAMLMVFGLAAFGVSSTQTSASSHREAPLITADPLADATDVYAFVSPEAPNSVTLIANWIPLQQPAAGPNFYNFSDEVQYEINLDTQGLARANVTYQFRFRTDYRSKNTFLYNTGQVTSLSDTDLNVRQFYTVTKIMRTFAPDGTFQGGSSQVLVSNAQVAPANIGPRSTPNYEANLATPAIKSLVGGGKVFAGPRDDPFFVDLGSAFDLLGLRPLNTAHLIPLDTEEGVDGVAGYNVHTTALQVPISSLGLQNGVVGVWSASKRQATRVINQFDGTITWSGTWVGISRLGMPLVNEVVVPLAFKDSFNVSRPDGDGRYASVVVNPEMPVLMNLLYPPLVDVPTTNRTDLVTVFLTGVPGVNQLPTVTASEMIRLNTGIAPASEPNRLGVVGGDNAGFPNGRRLIDDVVDIELRALACSYGVVGTLGPCDAATYNVSPNKDLTDGLDANEKPFTDAFPYMAEPYQGYEAEPPTTASAVGLAFAGIGLGAVALFAYRRRKTATGKATQDVVFE